MRKVSTLVFASVAASVWAAPQNITVDEAYARLTTGADKGVATGRFTANMAAVITEGNNSPILHSTSLDFGLNTFELKTYVDGVLKQTIVADGKRVWRFDPVRNEFAFMTQPTDIKAAFGIASAWMRNENQRFIRLFAVGVRWMIKPICSYDDVTGQLNMTQLTTGGNQWRGTMASFFIDPDPAKDLLYSMSIDERLDIPKLGLRVVAMDVNIDYSVPALPTPYTFAPPIGAKPALDMPNRGG